MTTKFTVTLEDDRGRETLTIHVDGRVSRSLVDILTIHVDRSAGSDGALLVMLDTDFEPDASDGSTGLRVLVNDGDAFVGVPYRR